MSPNVLPDDWVPLSASTAQPVEMRVTTMRIHDLKIERPGIIAYLQAIPSDKRALALVHALEVGVTEMLARRERFDHRDPPEALQH